MYQEEIERPAFSQRMGAVLDRAESIYLRVLRAAILVVATLLLAYAGWLAASSLYKISRSPSSVEEEVATVAATELTDAEMPAAERSRSAEGGPVVNPEHQRFYSDFVKRYYELFRTRFEPFKQQGDKQLTRDEFDDAFINTSERLEAATKGELNFAIDRADLENLLKVMSEAATLPATQQRLQRYKSAKKVAVQKKVQRMSADQLAIRILAEQSGISSAELRMGKISAQEFRSLARAAGDLQQLPLIIDDTPVRPRSD